MNTSPIRCLVVRHLCTCKTNVTTIPIAVRSLSTSAQNRNQHWTPRAATYGSAELLKRRYQKRPEDADKEKIEHARIKKRMRRAGFGIGACALGLLGTVFLYPAGNKSTKLDGPPTIPGAPETAIKDDVEQVPTGTSTIPHFPKQIYLSEVDAPADAAVADQGKQEYQLVGVGVRTVFYIQVYIVGLYVALPDVAKLQERLIRKVDPVATTLVPGEKGKLKDMLVDATQGQEIWNDVLKDGGIRMALKIIPTRNTDFVHLRDGWVRGITSKTQELRKLGDQSFADESFGVSLNDFKTVLGGGFRKKVPWGDTILLTRDGKGTLNSWYEDQKGESVNLGKVSDERISRLLWLIYLGGAKVSSEPLKKSVIEGVVELVGRPVGTVATQVV